jgi:hypothetical protein
VHGFIIFNQRGTLRDHWLSITKSSVMAKQHPTRIL